MSEKTTFDVLIFYTGTLANSANSPSEEVTTPFTKGSKEESYNIVYGYFLNTCQKNNLKAAFTTSDDIIGAGKCKSYWLFENKTWVKIPKIGFSKLIFDKCSPTRRITKFKRGLLFSSGKVRPFNNPYLFNICFDKQKTYNKLHKLSIPTVTIRGISKKCVGQACMTLKRKIVKHPHREDFNGEVVVKDRFGAGGRNVYKFKFNQTDRIAGLTRRHPQVSFVIQPFVKFDKGYNYQKSPVATDIRLIYFGNRIIQTYIRIAKNGDFRCNEHQGGKLKYITVKKVPSAVVKISRNIARILDKKSSLFALDFIISNNGNVYLLEANTGPGLDWNLSIKANEIEAKRLIRLIVKEIVKRVGSPKKYFR
jgi:glutathione synthase/RimK-type ligase-like ATP-grasp enzyme